MNDKIVVKKSETEILLNEEIVRKAMLKLENNSEFDSLRELIDFLLEQWTKRKKVSE